MRKKLLATGLLTVTLLSACGKGDALSGADLSEPEVDTEVYTENLEIKDASEVVPMGEPFTDPFEEGSLNYTVQGCNVYHTLEEAKVERDMLTEPYNNYFSMEMHDQYRNISDFVNEDGSVVDTHEFVVLDIQIENEDAVGREKKNEFNIMNLAVRGGKDVSEYYVAYFSEAGKVNSEQTLHYELEQGSSKNVRLGFFVLKEDVENMVGAIYGGFEDIQFAIRE